VGRLYLLFSITTEQALNSPAQARFIFDAQVFHSGHSHHRFPSSRQYTRSLFQAARRCFPIRI